MEPAYLQKVTAKLDQNGTGGSGVVAGSLISVPYGQPAPAGYSLYQQGEPKELVWGREGSRECGKICLRRSGGFG